MAQIPLVLGGFALALSGCIHTGQSLIWVTAGHCPWGCKPLTIALFRIFRFQVPELSGGLCCSLLVALGPGRGVPSGWSGAGSRGWGGSAGLQECCWAQGGWTRLALRWVLAVNFSRGTAPLSIGR